MKLKQMRTFFWVGLVGLVVTVASEASFKDIGKLVWLSIPNPEAVNEDEEYGGCFEFAGSGFAAPYFTFFEETDHYDSSLKEGETIMSLALLEKAAGLQIWKKNSYSKIGYVYDGSDTPGCIDDHCKEFGHYNPAFVDWAFTVLIPGRRDSNFRKKTQARYDACLSHYARTAWASLKEVSANTTCRDKLIQEYKKSGEDEFDSMRGLGGNWLETCVPEGKQFNTAEDLEAIISHPDDLNYTDIGHTIDFTYSPPEAYFRFWFRREVDGSRPNFERGLLNLLKTYDSEWLANYGKPAHIMLKNKGYGTPKSSDVFAALVKETNTAQSQLQKWAIANKNPAQNSTPAAESTPSEIEAITWIKYENPIAKELGDVGHSQAIMGSLICNTLLRTKVPGCNAVEHRSWTKRWCDATWGHAIKNFGSSGTKVAVDALCESYVSSYSTGAGGAEYYHNGRSVTFSHADCVSMVYGWCK